MNDVELAALTALVNNQTAQTNAEVAQFGAPQCDPCTDELVTLTAELRRRGILPKPEEMSVEGAVRDAYGPPIDEAKEGSDGG